MADDLAAVVHQSLAVVRRIEHEHGFGALPQVCDDVVEEADRGVHCIGVAPAHVGDARPVPPTPAQRAAVRAVGSLRRIEAVAERVVRVVGVQDDGLQLRRLLERVAHRRDEHSIRGVARHDDLMLRVRPGDVARLHAVPVCLVPGLAQRGEHGAVARHAHPMARHLARDEQRDRGGRLVGARHHVASDGGAGGDLPHARRAAALVQVVVAHAFAQYQHHRFQRRCIGHAGRVPTGVRIARVRGGRLGIQAVGEPAGVGRDGGGDEHRFDRPDLQRGGWRKCLRHRQGPQQAQDAAAQMPGTRHRAPPRRPAQGRHQHRAACCQPGIGHQRGLDFVARERAPLQCQVEQVGVAHRPCAHEQDAEGGERKRRHEEAALRKQQPHA